MDKRKIEKIYLEDGRAAERHIGVNDAGERITEIYVEEHRPFKLEKRITEKRKEILAEQKIEKVENGEVVDVKLLTVEPTDTKLQVREHIGVADNAELRSLNYASKKDVADAVIAGISVLLERQAPQPILSSQSIIEERQDKNKNKEVITIVGLLVAAVVQIALAYYFLA